MKKKAVKKWAMYAGLGLLVMILQEFLLTRLSVFGIHPMLGGVLTAAVAVFEGGIAGGAFGMFIGVLQDSMVVGPEGYYSLVYFGCGMATGFICQYMFHKSFLTAGLWSVIITAFTTLFYYLIFYLLTGRAGIAALWMIAAPEIIYSVLFLPLIYYPVKHICGFKELD